ncbi:MAG: hypothetical protein ABSC64_07590 [Candidatus Korobacteraceae bacterium]
MKTLVAIAAAAYLSQAWVAIATGRHLFGDGSWLLLRLLAENHITHLNNNTWNDFFVGRLGSFSYQQLPTLFAARSGVHSLRVLSVVFGVTLFSFKPLSLLLCYRFARDKRYVLFPLLSLFAGTMNSEGYLISETHLMSALFWAALFGLLCPREFGWFDLAAMIVVSAPLILCYETMAMFGLVLVGVCIYRRLAIAKSPREKWLTIVFGAWYSLGVIFAMLAIIFPRDPTQRADFFKGLLFVFHYQHIGARVSCIVLILCALVLLIPAIYKKTLNVLVGLAIACSLAIPVCILIHPELTSLDEHIVARTMNASVPLALAAAFLAVYFGLVQVDTRKYKRLFVIAAVLGICQSAWSVVASEQWSLMLNVLRSELRTQTGLVPFNGSLLSRPTLGGQPMRTMHADWPLLSLSIVYADEGKVQAILLPPSTSFYPFDPRIPSALPRLERFHIDYSRYLAAVPKTSPYELGEWIDFGDGGNALPYETGGWWKPEPWGTWTAEQAGLTIDLSGDVKSDLVMETVAAAFVNEKNPAVNVQVLVNEVPAGKWSFRFKSGAPEYQTYRLVLSQKALNKALPVVIRFRVSGAGSPAAAGLSDDARMLGLAVRRLRLLAQ